MVNGEPLRALIASATPDRWTKARDHQRHVTELMNRAAMEGMQGIWRYGQRVLAQRKNALAVLLRLRGG
jgi:hypothetical protein